MQSIRGRLKALSIADLLEFLRHLNRPGLLSVTAEGTAIGLYLSAGRVVHATSTCDADRLTSLLLRWGWLSPEQHDETMRRAAGGERIGKALVQSGLAPRRLMEARLRQVRGIAGSLFEWDAGEFVFLEGETPPEEGITVDLSLTEVVVEGIRSVRNLRLFRERLPSRDWVFEAIPAGERRVSVPLQPHEEYVLNLADGTRTIGEIHEVSEFPELETLRVLFLLYVTGCARAKAQTGADTIQDEARDEVTGMVQRYNARLALLYRHLAREVGPITDHLLMNSLRALQESRPALFARATLGGDGTIDGERLLESLRGIGAGQRREALIEGLNELLYSEMLIVRKVLGPEHEKRILRAFGDLDADAGVPVVGGGETPPPRSVA
ncbi:MAG TPA: DUF4388 domain-containing protein [Candidatus Polarisedimenticolia bacterium]|nr:DUF4388 domain-containing protein [Candidatus Polarisedimenticolia bacterium]